MRGIISIFPGNATLVLGRAANSREDSDVICFHHKKLFLILKHFFLPSIMQMCLFETELLQQIFWCNTHRARGIEGESNWKQESIEVVRNRGKMGGEDQRVKIDWESFSAGEAEREEEEGGWVQRKQLVKTELLFKWRKGVGGQRRGRQKGDKGKAFKETYIIIQEDTQTHTVV